MSSYDQLPEGWSSGAGGYAEQFMLHTRPYAADALELIGVGSGTRVLDVAAGTGAATLEAAGRGATVVATDFAAGMVDQLRAQVERAGLSGSVSAEVMDGQALTLPDDSVDAAISMFGWMFFPDTDAGLHELHRVVRPGGRIALGIWNLEGFALRQLIGAAMAEALPGFDPGTGVPSWARIGDPAVFRSEVERAGFTDMVVHTVWHRWELPDPRSFCETMGEWTPVWKPVMDRLTADERARLADAFVNAVRAAESQPNGIQVAADICTATVPE
ncbi:MAG: class I SAM-dependent methyltransferase [Actinomycetota bacterium]|nr:class I SAM-dependent methyltransferase [Actinomycetota bacterium]